MSIQTSRRQEIPHFTTHTLIGVSFSDTATGGARIKLHRSPLPFWHYQNPWNPGKSQACIKEVKMVELTHHTQSMIVFYIDSIQPHPTQWHSVLIEEWRTGRIPLQAGLKSQAGAYIKGENTDRVKHACRPWDDINYLYILKYWLHTRIPTSRKRKRKYNGTQPTFRVTRSGEIQEASVCGGCQHSHLPVCNEMGLLSRPEHSSDNIRKACTPVALLFPLSLVHSSI